MALLLLTFDPGLFEPPTSSSGCRNRNIKELSELLSPPDGAVRRSAAPSPSQGHLTRLTPTLKKVPAEEGGSERPPRPVFFSSLCRSFCFFTLVFSEMQDLDLGGEGGSGDPEAASDWLRRPAAAPVCVCVSVSVSGVI